VVSMSRVLGVLGFVALIGGPLCMAPAAAQTTPAAPAAATTVSGVATDTNGAPLANATLRFRGPADYTVTTDARGAYRVTVVPGVYTVTASKSGYNQATEQDFTVVAGQPSTLNVQLSQATLTSLQQIGRVTTRVRGSVFNATPASVQTVTNQTFQDQGQQQVQRVLDQTPGIVIDHPGTSATNASPGAITFPSIRGGLGFETSSLIDGHPLAVGNFGDYVTSFLNADTFQSIELVKGPGANLGQINFAINGAVNFRTLDVPSRAVGQIKYGVDSLNGTFSNFRYGNTLLNGKLGFILDYAIIGDRGPLYDQPGMTTVSSTTLINGSAQSGSTTSGSAVPGIQNSPTFVNATLLACCLNVPQTYTNKNELVKLKYNFSGTTSLTASYLGSQTYTDQNGNHVYQFFNNFVPGASYAPGATGLAPGPVQTFQNVFYPYTEFEINNEPIFQWEIRTGFHNDNILARYYTASINRLQYNPLQSPLDSFTIPLRLYGTVNLCPPGQAVVSGRCGSATGPAPTQTPFNGQNANVTFNPSGGVCGGPNTGWIASGVKNSAGVPCGQPGNPFTGFTTPQYFRAEEADSLHGSSFEWDHPIGQNGMLLTLAYDQTNSRTTARDYPGAPTVPGVPAGSYEIYRTYLARLQFNLGQRTNVTLSNYINTYTFHYTPNGGIPAIGGTANVANPHPTFFDEKLSHFDPRLGVTYRANPDTSFRLSVGSAIAPPYLNFLSRSTTTPSANNASSPTFYTNSAPNGNIKPETAFEWDLGGDFRFRDGQTILTTDLYWSHLQNQFFTSVQQNGCYNGTTFAASNPDGTCPAGGPPPFLPLFSTQNRNLANARYEGIEMALTRDPAVGLGFKLQGALQRAYPYAIPPCFYSTNNVCTGQGTNLAVLPNENYVGNGTAGTPGSFNGINNHSIPYAQGYFELHYRTPNGGYAGFGEQYYGNNNSLNVPAFLVAHLDARFPIGGRSTGLTLNANVDNLFQAYPNPYITQFGGVAYPLVNGNVGLTNANSIGPRNLRVSVIKNF
jgi:outer membrane receptor protein involved in Fe transport